MKFVFLSAFIFSSAASASIVLQKNKIVCSSKGFGFSASTECKNKIGYLKSGEQVRVIEQYTDASGRKYLRVQLPSSAGSSRPELQAWIFVSPEEEYNITAPNSVDQPSRPSQPTRTPETTPQTTKRPQTPARPSRSQRTFSSLSAMTLFQITERAKLFCNESQSNSQNIWEEMAKEAIKSTSPFKSQSELDEYVRCYAESDSAYRTYLSLKPTFEDIAEFYGVPAQLMTCLALRESRFNPTSRNPTSGALGLYHFLNAPAATVTLLLEEPELTDLAEQRYIREPYRYINAVEKPTQNLAYQKTGWAIEKLTMRFLSEVDTDYWRSQSYFRGAAPSEFKYPEHAIIPERAAPAAALYLRYMWAYVESDIVRRGRPSPFETLVNDDQIEFMVLLAGMHNIGQGHAAAALRNVTTGNTKDYIRALENFNYGNHGKNAEVKAHMNFIRGCMKRDDWSRPNGEPPRLNSCTRF